MEQNDASAQYVLSGCYHQGQGVIKDEVEAYKWCLLAADQGFQLAKDGISQLEITLPSAQLAEGKKLARDFRPRKSPFAEHQNPTKAILPTPPKAPGAGNSQHP